MMHMNIIHNIWNLQGKNADESPPPQDLPARAATLLGKVIHFYAGHYAPVSQGEKSYTDPSTGGPTCKTNEIIYDVIREKKTNDDMVTFSRRWTREERVVIKMSLLSTDEIPKSVYSYFRNRSENIAKDASCRCGFQISVSDITVQHLTVFFAHRGGKGNLGKKRSAEHCARISEGKKGKKYSAATCARISEGNLGKKLSAATCARISEGKKGKKHSAEHCARISEGNLGKKRSAATCARISEGKKGKKRSAEHCARISEGKMGVFLPIYTATALGSTQS